MLGDHNACTVIVIIHFSSLHCRRVYFSGRRARARRHLRCTYSLSRDSADAPSSSPVYQRRGRRAGALYSMIAGAVAGYFVDTENRRDAMPR